MDQIIARFTVDRPGFTLNVDLGHTRRRTSGDLARSSQNRRIEAARQGNETLPGCTFTGTGTGCLGPCEVGVRNGMNQGVTSLRHAPVASFDVLAYSLSVTLLVQLQKQTGGSS